MDTVKVDDPKQSEMANQEEERKLDKSGSRVEHVFMPTVLSQLQLSPQPKIPSKPNTQKTTKLLDRLPAAGNLGIFYAVKPANLPVEPVVTTIHAQRDNTKVTNNCFNGTICIERICFRPQSLPSCPTTSYTSSSTVKIAPIEPNKPLVPTTTIKTHPVVVSVTWTDPGKTTTKSQPCCNCPGICVEVNLCNAKQLPICSALPRCATGHCAQNCCGR
ncbi:Hypothetical predicted protein [Paramuricea clavata]|uniref:Uncharacterized protein n=1 Tax=Paramuricea clavata TaxID=317549 RepID=A0A7D9K0I1_PARCT|nr:Hypothetical predicted protein [Paramuricea clavata]